MATRITLHRHRTPHGERLTLLGPDYAVTIELTVRGIELAAGDVDKMLHAPLTVLGRDRI